MEFSPPPLIPHMLTAMGLGEGNAPSGRRRTTSAALWLIGWPVFLVGVLGVRVIVVPTVLKELFRPNPATAERTHVSVLLASGCVLAMTFTITSDCGASYNNSVWFFVQSKLVVWIFVAEAVRRLMKGRSRALQALLLSGLVTLSVPSTLQCLGKEMDHLLIVLDKSTMDIMGFLRRASAPGDVVFCHQDLATRVIVLTRCRTPLADVYPICHISQFDLTQRQADLADFWKTGSQEERRRILERYKSAYWILDKRTDKRPGPGDDLAARPVFENDEFVVYRAPNEASF